MVGALLRLKFRSVPPVVAGEFGYRTHAPMDSLAEVQKVSALFSDLPCPWFICGGWAIDLFLNRVTRQHKDVDVAIAREDQFRVRDYLRQRGWSLQKAVNGDLIPWADGEWLTLPIHGVWCSNEKYVPDFVELLLNEIDEMHFRFRRDQSITLARERMSFKAACGVPALAPEIVLLYKSNCAEEYEADFQNTVEALSEAQRAWLKNALNKLYAQPPWAERLQAGT